MTISISTKRKAIGFDYIGGSEDDLYLEGKEDGEWQRKKPITSLTPGEFEATYSRSFKGKSELRIVDAGGNVVDETPAGGLTIP